MLPYCVSKLGRVVLASATILATSVAPSQACTGLMLTNEDGTFVSGRIVEFGIKIDASAAMAPRGYSSTDQTPAGDSLKYTAKHAAAVSMPIPT